PHALCILSARLQAHLLVVTALPPPRSTLFPYTTLFRSRTRPGQRPRYRAGPPRLPVHRHPRRGQDHHRPHLRQVAELREGHQRRDRKSTRLNSSHVKISYAVFCLKKKKHLNRNHLLTTI